MSNPSDALPTAVAHHQAGRLDEAARIYEQVLAAEPQNADAMHLLGVVAHQRGQQQRAIDLISAAIRLEDGHGLFHNNLGEAYRACGNLNEAKACYLRAIGVGPRTPLPYYNLALVHAEQGDMPAVAQRCRQALELKPDYREVLHLLARALRALGDEAGAELQSAMAMQLSGQVDTAIERYRRAIALQPRNALAHYNLGTALDLLGRRDEASEQFLATLELDPKFPGADTNLGAYYQDQGDFQRALAHFDRSLAISPDAAKPHFNRGLILLAQGNMAAGWPEFEWRLKLPAFPVHRFDSPRWHGETIADKTLLVHAEQGLGDTLQFIRYLPLIEKRAGRVVTLVNPPLLPLLRQSGYQHLVGDPRELTRVDFQVPMVSLPGIVGTTLDNIPATIPYLLADPQLVAAWRQRLRDVAGFRVGICWQGSAKHASDSLRSVDLATFEPLARVSGVRLISLQKREGEEQLRGCPFEAHQLGVDWDQTAGPFMDTAAVMQNLDLVITVDTAIAHLAGALGVSVWVVLGSRTDWRWMLDRPDSPWYPSMRLFRQSKPNDWQELFQRVAAALGERITTTTH